MYKNTGLILIAGVLAIGLALGACSTSQTATTVAASEVALTAADQAALKYVTLPLCTGSNGPLCSTAAVSAQIKLAAQTAYNAVTAAKNGNGTEAAAAAAVAALVTLTTNLSVN